jgi:hypothetical protein
VDILTCPALASGALEAQQRRAFPGAVLKRSYISIFGMEANPSIPCGVAFSSLFILVGEALDLPRHFCQTARTCDEAALTRCGHRAGGHPPLPAPTKSAAQGVFLFNRRFVPWIQNQQARDRRPGSPRRKRYGATPAASAFARRLLHWRASVDMSHRIFACAAKTIRSSGFGSVNHKPSHPVPSRVGAGLVPSRCPPLLPVLQRIWCCLTTLYR